MEETKKTTAEELNEKETDKAEETCETQTEVEKEQQTEPKEDPKDAVIVELKDRYTRQLAEFENFRKRTDKEKQSMFDMGAKMVIEKILPVVDNFERALASVPEDVKDSSFTDGVDKIYKQLMKTFDEVGVEPIKAEGEKFDPNFHNAVMTDSESDAEEDTVTADLLKGYTYKGEVVRHSMVKVKK